MYLGGGHAARDNGRSNAISPISLDRRLSLLTLLAALFFLWPLLAYGRPGYIQDSAAYYKGGRMAVTFVLDKIGQRDAAPAAGNAGDSRVIPGPQTPNDAKGARSVAYSIAAFVLGAPNAQMWLLCVLQALATGFLSSVTLLLFARPTLPVWWKLALLAVATPVAFVVCLAIPDIFAGLVILAITLLATAHHGLSVGVRTVSTLIAAAAIAFHMSHVPIALGMTACALAWTAFVRLRLRTPVPRARWLWVAAPFLLGAAATIAFNFVAFGGPSLTGKRYPLTLARSVAEGPGKWYLDRNCGHLKYAICEIYPHGVPATINALLWGPDGLKRRATPEQMDRIRAEESDVVFAATRAYPLTEVERLGTNFARQLVLFEPGVGLLNSRIVQDPDGTPQLASAGYSHFWTDVVHWLTAVSLIAALVVLYRRFRADPSLRPMILLVVAGILFNDVVCIYFSGIVDRYGARTIWLLPLLALALLETSRGAA
ncbi:MAG: hypothetical protein ABI454_06405, partial [Sphingomicrobium sp.]